MAGTMIARGNMVASFMIAPSLTPAALSGAAGPQEQTFTVAGLQMGDFVDVSCNAAQTAKVSLGGARVSAANTLAVTFVNTDTGTPTPTAGQYLIVVSRPESYSNLPLTAA